MLRQAAATAVPTVGHQTMLLRNIERYLEVLEIGVGQELPRRSLTDSERDIPTQGFFFDYGGTTFGLGVSRGAILVLLRNQLVVYGPGFATQIQEDGECRVFTASQDGAALVNVTYSPNKPFWNFFSMVDEDVDGFLWLHNVLSSAERRAIIVENNGG